MGLQLLTLVVLAPLLWVMARGQIVEADITMVLAGEHAAEWTVAPLFLNLVRGCLHGLGWLVRLLALVTWLFVVLMLATFTAVSGFAKLLESDTWIGNLVPQIW